MEPIAKVCEAVPAGDSLLGTRENQTISDVFCCISETDNREEIQKEQCLLSAAHRPYITKTAVATYSVHLHNTEHNKRPIIFSGALSRTKCRESLATALATPPVPACLVSLLPPTLSTLPTLGCPPSLRELWSASHARQMKKIGGGLAGHRQPVE